MAAESVLFGRSEWSLSLCSEALEQTAKIQKNIFLDRYNRYDIDMIDMIDVFSLKKCFYLTLEGSFSPERLSRQHA